ncbi:YbaB/EbfC family nucleoid-associated protein [Krasilnikovia sp. M28-CT-15]|uniref:YbaB/EbfC family nucleoid-associated protein n=1 Tax=Krasilnikovia sp. M28-CT-15 TaxID=3373540 RepID=UPI0038764816
MDFDQQITDLTTRYRRQLAGLGRMQRDIADVTATVTGPRNAVGVTVDAHGDIVDLVFPTAAYRAMAPAELATLLRGVLSQARADAAGQVADIVHRHQGDQGRLGAAAGATDWSTLMPQDPPLPAMVRDWLSARSPRPGGRAEDSGQAGTADDDAPRSAGR